MSPEATPPGMVSRGMSFTNALTNAMATPLIAKSATLASAYTPNRMNTRVFTSRNFACSPSIALIQRR